MLGKTKLVLMAGVVALMTACSGIGEGAGLSLTPSAKVADKEPNVMMIADALHSSAKFIESGGVSEIADAFEICSGARTRSCQELQLQWGRLVEFNKTKEQNRAQLFVCDGFCQSIKDNSGLSYAPGRESLDTVSSAKVEIARDQVETLYFASKVIWEPQQYLTEIAKCRQNLTAECESFIELNRSQVSHVRGAGIGMSDEGCGAWCRTHRQVHLMLTMPEEHLDRSFPVSSFR